MKAILRKVLFGLMAAVALAVATGVLVAAAAFALYALLRGPLGAPGAAAAVALAAAVLIGLVGLVFAALAKPAKPAKGGEDQDLLQKLIAMARDKPIISIGALIGAVTLAIRNPAVVAIVVKALLDPAPRSAKKAK